MLCFYIDGFLFPVDTFWLFSWPLLSLFGFSHFPSSVCVMFCSTSCIPVAHLAPCTRKKTKTYLVAAERICTKCYLGLFFTEIRDTHSEEITDIFQVFVKQMSYLLMQNDNIHRGPENTTKAQLLQDTGYIVYSRRCRICDRKCKVMVLFQIVFYYLIVLGRYMSLQWVGVEKESELSNTSAAVCEIQSANKKIKN